MEQEYRVKLPDGTETLLTKEAYELLQTWAPNQPIRGGTYYTGLGSRARKNFDAARTTEEIKLGL